MVQVVRFPYSYAHHVVFTNVPVRACMWSVHARNGGEVPFPPALFMHEEQHTILKTEMTYLLHY